jgi:hypothetical protein
MSKKDGGAGKQANIARMEEAQRQATIRQGTDQINSTFDSQFTPDFFNKQRDNFLAFQLPQLDGQYGDAQRQLTFNLARNGNLDSSTRGFQQGQLQKTYNTQRTTVADNANSYANSARSNVEQARNNLISTLNATGDATQAASSATNQAAILAQPAAYSPLVDAFATTTGALASQAQADRAAAIANGTYTGGSGLFGTSGGSVRVTR